MKLDLGNGYTLSIVPDGAAGLVEVALIHDDYGFINTSLWFYDVTEASDFYDDVVRHMDSDQLIIALVKAKAYAKGE
jgi:hypothetical protein